MKIISLLIILLLPIINLNAKENNDNGFIDFIADAVIFSFDSYNTDLKITDSKLNLKYSSSGSTTPITIKGKESYFGNSDYFGYEIFSLTLNSFFYKHKVGKFYLLNNSSEDIVGRNISFTPSIFYIHKFPLHSGINIYGKAILGAGISLLNLDASNIDYLDLNNKWGKNFSTGLDFGVKFDKMGSAGMKITYLEENFKNRDINYEINGFSYMIYIGIQLEHILH